MTLTEGNIKKNLSKCCLKSGENVKAFLICKSKIHKNVILALTSNNRLVMGSIRVFGKMKSMNELTPNDITLFDFKSSSKGTELYKIDLKYKNLTDEIRVIKHPLSNAEHVKNIAQAIYSINPSAMPGDLKGDGFLGLITGSTKMIKFTSSKIIVEDIKKKTTENFEYNQVTNFDYYFQTIGDVAVFYIEINNEPKTYKVSAGGDLDLVKLHNIFKQTNSHITMPKYMVGDNNVLMDTGIKFKAGKLSNLKNNMLRVTDKNLYILQVKDKHPQVKEIIPFSDIKSYRQYEEIIETDNREHTNYGIEITKNDNSKTTFFSEGPTPSEIEQIIEIINK